MPDGSLPFVDISKADLQKLNHAVCQDNELDVRILRLDRIHPIISGNKWFKLKFYLQAAKERHMPGLVTFGGPWSNHLHATAYACREANLKCIGIIRGELKENQSQLLQDCADLGMELVHITREEYRQGAAILEQFPDINEQYLEVPEGGFGEYGIRGAAEIYDLLAPFDPQLVACSLGTGTMMCGLLSQAQPHQEVIGYSSLKLPDPIRNDFQNLASSLNSKGKFRLVPNYHFGGYARKTAALVSFMNEWYRTTGVPTDFVYTAKLFYGVMDMMYRGEFPRHSRICIIHSGGLQGNRSLPPQTLCY